jgi:NAD(P)-dependent dehydrogenase (short-subunit alcohol dehydrogenase family)
MGRLEGKVAIITGAGQGIGLAYAKRFLAEGAKVVVAEVVEDRAAGAMKELQGDGDVIFVKTDISDPDSAQHCIDETMNAFGTVHVLVNNAALYYDIDNFDTSFEYLQRVTAVNQHGAWLMTRAAAPVMAAQHYGRVINQSSGAAYAYLFPAFGDDFTGHRRPDQVHGRAARRVEHHRQLHRAGRHDDRSDKKSRARHVHPGHDRDDGNETHARTRRPRRRMRLLRERRRQVRDRPDPCDRRRPRDACVMTCAPSRPATG